MPELPEVETIRKGLEDLIIGYTVVGIKSESAKQVLPSLEKVKTAIIGKKIRKIGRIAKITLVEMESGQILAVHLKLTGRLLVRKKGEPKDEWQRVTLSLREAKRRSNLDGEIAAATTAVGPRNDVELRFCDARKFGWVKLLGGLGELGKLGVYGPEPFDFAQGKPFLNPDFNIDYLQKIFSKTNKPIKVVIMDQEKIAGIGNIYANDALFLAGIDPRRKTNSLNVTECKSLKDSIETVLKRGLQYGGASDQYYLNARGQKGFYQDHFLVYGKRGKPCPNHCGGIIKRIVVGGRGTFLCEKCQN